MSAQRADPVAGLIRTDARAGAQDLTRGARASAGRAIAGGRPPQGRWTSLARRAAGGDVRIDHAHVTACMEPVRASEAALHAVAGGRPLLGHGARGARLAAGGRLRVGDATAAAIVSTQRAYAFTGSVFRDARGPAQRRAFGALGTTLRPVAGGEAPLRDGTGRARIAAAELVGVRQAVVAALVCSLQTHERHAEPDILAAARAASVRHRSGHPGTERADGVARRAPTGCAAPSIYCHGDITRVDLARSDEERGDQPLVRESNP